MSTLSQTIQGLINTSQPFVICECRGGQVEEIKYVDKKSGRQASFAFFAYTVEPLAGKVTPTQIRVDLPPNTKPEDAKAEFQKGQRILAVITGITVERGLTTYRASSMIPAPEEKKP